MCVSFWDKSPPGGAGPCGLMEGGAGDGLGSLGRVESFAGAPLRAGSPVLGYLWGFAAVSLPSAAPHSEISRSFLGPGGLGGAQTG